MIEQLNPLCAATHPKAAQFAARLRRDRGFNAGDIVTLGIEGLAAVRNVADHAVIKAVELVTCIDDGLAQARASNEGPVLIEIMLDRLDASDALKRLCAELSPDKGRRTAKA